MRTFSYERASGLQDVWDAMRTPDTQLLAGGTELMNWMKEGIESPRRLLDISHLPLTAVERDGDCLRVGALARMSDVAAHPVVQQEYPVLAQSLLRAASPQLRNMATIGGNLMQRTRCPYFRADTSLPCNKRQPGSGCAARTGDVTAAAIFGWHDSCVATHPSDPAVALAALDANVIVRRENGERVIAAAEFHRLPGTEPHRHNALDPGELIVAVEIPASPSARRSHYLKVRERAAYEFAVVSVASVIRLDGRRIIDARLALGGVAHRPWRLRATEPALIGADIGDEAALYTAVERSFADARPLPGNEFKVTLAQRASVRALQEAG